MTVEEKLAKLRVKWKNHPELRSVIERQARALKYSQSVDITKEKKASESFVADVLEELVN